LNTTGTKTERPSTILVVDDDEGLLILMAEVLRAEGHEVFTASSGTGAQAWLAEHSADLMLLDLKMKDVGGTALVKRLKRSDAPVPFVVVTGQGDEKVAVEVMKQGALDYVMKDTGLLDLLPTVVKRALQTVERERDLAAATDRLRESEARLAAALRATNDGVWEWQIPEQRIYFSARWKAILGYKPEEIEDSLAEWKARVHPDDRARLAKAEEECFAGDSAVFSIEYRLQHKDRSYRWILLRASLQRDQEGKPLRMIGADADITVQKELEKEILRISDREQWRIGQELHDGLGQQLTAIEFMCESLKADLGAERPEVGAQFTQITQCLREAVSQTRSLAHGLTPFMLDAGGLQAGLEELTQRMNSLGRLKCRFVCPFRVPIKESEIASHLFRIAQEAVNNALKHSGATEVTISLTSSPGDVRIQIVDDGKGFPRTARGREGIGLHVMKHRANAIGADLTIDSTPGKGVTVTCTLQRSP
jgi:PAS domain S-box-containing protein